MYSVPDLPWSLPVSNEIVSDALPARRPKASPRHLHPKQELLVPPVPRPALQSSQASNTKERKGNVPTVARWGISRQTKSVPPEFLLMFSSPLLFPLQGRGRSLPLLRYPGKSREKPLSMLVLTGAVDLDGLDSRASPTGNGPFLFL